MTGPLGPERPTTEAGRQRASIPFLDGDDEPIDLTDDILAIEAEARADSQREALPLGVENVDQLIVDQIVTALATHFGARRFAVLLCHPRRRLRRRLSQPRPTLPTCSHRARGPGRGRAPVSRDLYEHLTDAELAMEVYLAIIRPDEELPDGVMEKFRPAWQMASALQRRLAGPYCNHAGCRLPHMESFPWCPWHRPESYGPLPDGFPAYPGAA